VTRDSSPSGSGYWTVGKGSPKQKGEEGGAVTMRNERRGRRVRESTRYDKPGQQVFLGALSLISQILPEQGEISHPDSQPFSVVSVFFSVPYLVKNISPAPGCGSELS